jgi:hypothetical protein
MKNNIIIRLENTMFNTKNIENHLPKAIDKQSYINTSLPKCKANNNLLEINELLSKIKAMGKNVNVKIVTGFRGNCVYRLLERNGVLGVRVQSTIEQAMGGSEKESIVVISTSEKDKEVAMQNGVAIVSSIDNKDLILESIGLKKTKKSSQEAA